MGPGGKSRKEVKNELEKFGIVNPQLSLLRKLYLVDGENRPGDQIRFYDKFSNKELKIIINKSDLVEKSKEYYNQPHKTKKDQIRKETYSKIDNVVTELQVLA